MGSGHLDRLWRVKTHQIQQSFDFMGGQFLTDDMQTIGNQSGLGLKKGNPKPVHIYRVQVPNLVLRHNASRQRPAGRGAAGPPLGASGGGREEPASPLAAGGWARSVVSTSSRAVIACRPDGRMVSV